MNKHRFTLPLVLAACCLLATSAAAAEGGFSLNPFASKKKPPAKAMSDEGPDGTTIPAAGGTSSESKPKKKTSAKPSSWQKFNAGTQNFFAKSKDVLMPWSKSKPAKPAAQTTGTTKTYSGSSLSQKPAKKSTMFGNMFGGDDQDEPNTVEDFIGQPRPPF